MLPFVEIAFAGPEFSKSTAHRSLDFARSGGRATIAAWLLTLISPADGAAPREATPTRLERLTAPVTTLTDALPCQVQWLDYHVRRALGLPCTPPIC